MKIALAAYECRNHDMEFNLSQIEKAFDNAKGKADIVCFGESFVQGFDALTWNYEVDKEIAVSMDSIVFKKLCDWTVQYGVDLLIGYFEKNEGKIYSSCAVIEKGTVIHNYRRITKNWKEYEITDNHYQEGTEVKEFEYKNHKIMISLCGDLWTKPQLFQTNHLLIWPVYVNFSLEEWEQEEVEYAKQANLVSRKTLLINSISKEPKALGNAFYFENGTIKDKLAFGIEGMLITEFE